MKRSIPIDTKTVRELADLLKETDLSEIEIEHNGARIRVARQVAVAQTTIGVAPTAAHPSPKTEVLKGDDRRNADRDPSEHPGTLASPMVGTAYRSPEPGAPTFVEVGDTVQEGQTVLIVEAMKTMNHIPSPRAGKVHAIMVEDGQPVEYGEPLMILE